MFLYSCPISFNINQLILSSWTAGAWTEMVLRAGNCCWGAWCTTVRRWNEVAMATRRYMQNDRFDGKFSTKKAIDKLYDVHTCFHTHIHSNSRWWWRWRLFCAYNCSIQLLLTVYSSIFLQNGLNVEWIWFFSCIFLYQIFLYDKRRF